MGVSGLYTDVILPASVRMEFAELRAIGVEVVGIDASSWLHSGARLDPIKFHSEAEDKNQKLVDFCTYRVNMLKKAGIDAHFVFDGRQFQLKNPVTQARLKSREKGAQQALNAKEAGDDAGLKAGLKRSTKITHSMVSFLIKGEYWYSVAGG